MSHAALPEGTSCRALAADAGALVVVHGRSVGCKFELRRRQVTVGGGAGDGVRLDGLAPCVLRLDRVPTGWSVTRLADTLDVGVDGLASSRGVLAQGGELWIDSSILRLVPSSAEAYEDVLFRVSTLDGVTTLATDRWLHELVSRDRVRAERAAVPLSLATIRLVGLADVWATRGPVATHRLLRAIALRLRATLGDRPLGRVNGTDFTALLEGNFDARYPYVDALRRAIAEVAVETRDGTVSVRAVAAIADLPAGVAIETLEASIRERLGHTSDGLVVVD